MKHHIFRAQDLDTEKFKGVFGNEWFHCAACPCDEEDEVGYAPENHKICQDTDSDTIAAMIATGIFGENYEPDNVWWK